MWQFFKSPLVRISFGLVMLTVAMLLLSDFLGLVPDTKKAELHSRKVIAESLAVQLSTEVVAQNIESAEETLRSVVERNDKVLSGAIRMGDGNILAEYGGHGKYWTLQPDGRSTPMQVRVPLFNRTGRWGSVELCFKEISGYGEWALFQNSFLVVILFVALAGFLSYLLFLKRTMRELNPDAVIPERVRKALDTLTEGLLIVDKDSYIVFSNTAFAQKTGLTPQQLVGKKITALYWNMDSIAGENIELPWSSVLMGREATDGAKVRLKTAHKKSYTFTVHVSPINASADKIKGVLITFDDTTDIEAKNEELHRMLGKLEKSQREITRQNQELLVLATRDPLTNTLNRRSFFQGFENLLEDAQEAGEELSCIMVDIDHFKSVNDRFGHSVGDKVIKLLAMILTEYSRPNDLVGRFGGEEFCIVLPGANADIAFDIAERMRKAIQEGEGAKFTSALRITSSFGVSTLSDGASHHNEMVEQADKALYVAKESGRNRVIKWSTDLKEEEAQAETDSIGEQQLSGDTEILFDEQKDGIEQVIEFINPEFEQSQNQVEKNDGSRPDGPGVAGRQDKKLLLDKLLSSEETNQSNSNILLQDRINQGIIRAQRFNNHIAVMVIDVDLLQRTSETLGLVVTEKLSRTIENRLKQVLRTIDMVAIMEEDELFFSVSSFSRSEFVVLLTDINESQILTQILSRIFSVNDEPVEVEGNEFYVNSKVGVSLYPSDGEDSDALIRNAISAMQEAKQSSGRNNFRFYDDNINQLSKRQIHLEAELHHALERDELVVYYQPKVDLKTGRILGMEALLRWQHQQLGLVSPSEFIPLAEQTGQIEQVCEWVINMVCRQVKFWQEADYGLVNVAVNISPAEFKNQDHIMNIIRLVDENNVPSNAIELEITESVVMQNMDTAISTMEMLKDAGFIISVDDFGTGYSALSCLKRFPLSKVKIDRSFIAGLSEGPGDAAIVSAIIAMSHSLGLRVVAEGVETEEQMRFLQELHCDEIQGYLICKPMPAMDASNILSQSSSIQRLVTEYGIRSAGQAAHNGTGSFGGMFGLLNDFLPQTTNRQQ